MMLKTRQMGILASDPVLATWLRQQMSKCQRHTRVPISCAYSSVYVLIRNGGKKILARAVGLQADLGRYLLEGIISLPTGCAQRCAYPGLAPERALRVNPEPIVLRVALLKIVCLRATGNKHPALSLSRSGRSQSRAFSIEPSDRLLTVSSRVTEEA